MKHTEKVAQGHAGKALNIRDDALIKAVQQLLKDALFPMIED
jgi:hypothetical protein